MPYLNAILSLGILVVILPFLGFPQSFDNVLFVLSGIVIFVLSFLLKKESNESEDQKASGPGAGNTENQV